MRCPKCNVFVTFGSLSFTSKKFYYSCSECGFGSWDIELWMNKK